MVWILMLPLLFLLPTNLRSDSLKIGSQFRGLATDVDRLLLNEGFTHDSENVQTDTNLGLNPRKGFISFSTETADQMWVFNPSNANSYLVIRNGRDLKATLGGSNFTVFIGTVDENVQTAAVQFGDLFYYTNTTDGLKRWNETSVTIVSATINATQLVAWQGRLVATGVSTNRRIIYLSRYLNGDDWNLKIDSTDADPAQLQIGSNLDDTILCLFSSFNDYLMWFMAGSFGGVSGTRNCNFRQRVFSNEIGCSYPDSIKDCDGKLRWIANNRRTFEFDGESLKKISEGNDTLFGTVAQGDLVARSVEQTTAEHWGAGTTQIGLDTTTVSGNIIFSRREFPDDSFEDGDLTNNNPEWSVASGSWGIVNGNLQNVGSNSGRITALPSNQAPLSLVNATWYFENRLTFNSAFSSNYIRYWFFNGALANEGYFIEISTVSGDIRNRLIRRQSGIETVLISSSVPFSTYSTSISSSVKVIRNSDGKFELYRSSNILLGEATDTTFTSPSGVLHIDHLLDTNQLSISSFSTQSQNRYTARFQSQAISISSDITSWRTFNAGDTLNNGVITYTVYSDTDTTIDTNIPTTYTASQTVTNAQTMTLSTGTFAVVVATFSRTLSTNTPTLHDFTINWNQGTATPAPSVWFLNRWWLGVQISSTSNNKCLIYDRNNDWQRYSIAANAMIVHDSRLLFSNSVGLWQAETGTTDNGQSIPSYFHTKIYTMKGLDYLNTFRSLYLTSIYSNETLNTTYFVDGVNSELTLPTYNMSTIGSGYQNFKIPFRTTDLLQGKYISFKFAVTGTSNWRLLGGNFYYTPEQKLSFE